MSWDPLTYRGALRILGAADPQGLQRLDRILGGLILGAGVAGQLPALGVLAPVYGWADQKNEGLGIVRSLVTRSARRVRRASGLDRLQLVAAAHSAIVGAAFFENFREYVGPLDDALELTPLDRLRRLTHVPVGEGDEAGSIIEILYAAPVPMPSSVRGFHENLVHLCGFYQGMVERTTVFLAGLQAWNSGQWALRRKLTPVFFAAEAAQRYQCLFHEIAAAVPEFLVWSTLGEHGATRSRLRDLRDDVLEAHRAEMAALHRVEYLLRRMSAPLSEEPGDAPPMHPSREVLHSANRLALDDPIVPADSLRHVGGVTFPALRQIYVNPAFRFAEYQEGDRPADDRWWKDRRRNTDLDAFLAGHLMSRAATERPTLVLGHPGSGKSMLTQVLAARLPPQTHTVVRVPLRRVDADAPLHVQIRQSLLNATHGRVGWPDLADHSAGTIAVILLDGFDELLQAGGDSRTHYLHHVAEFQRVEAGCGRPVAVFVTTRTVVAERARIPSGTLLIRLEAFTDDNVRAWLDVWNHVNHVRISADKMLHVDPAAAVRYPDLAAQPLLLLMLALYMSDPDVRPIDGTVSTTVLYERLLDNFTRRELQRIHDRAPADPDRVAELVPKRLWELSVVAFAMFNRGSQYVTDEQLGGDLAAMIPGYRDAVATGEVRRSALAQGVIRGFFFVHTSELDLHHEEAKRSYEFLHATFGEFLLAASLLDRVAEAVAGNLADPAGAKVHDAQLFALLSHQALALRRSTLGFVRELFLREPGQRHRPLRAALRILLHNALRRGFTADYADYRPLPLHHVRGLAAYSANLLLLLLVCSGWEDEPARIAALGPPDEPDPEGWWSSLLHLWRSGLDDANTTALAETLQREPGTDLIRVSRAGSPASNDLRALFAAPDAA
ncbi:NACHT domain-containing protein [Dactylosporangium sp. McL0621]|uniref:NACHT domain-containing protein n=1 Tax=Dactylosporangium sp. McL0621 TaxID=3415678 RepID=UPI003CF38D86